MEKPGSARARCATHPAVPAVADCQACGRALCLECAIPVRGEVVGPECLARILPDPPEHTAVEPVPPARPLPDRLAVAGMAVAVIASLLPWTQEGLGSSMFGGWGFSPPRHAGLSGPLALAGLALVWWVTRPVSTASERVRVVVALLAGALVVGVSMLAVIHPVPFTRSGPAPWLAVAAGLATALARPLAAVIRPDRPDRAVA